MLKKRIIFALIYADGFFCQSRNFRLQKVGDLNWLEKNYHFKEVALSLDELIIVNASKEKKDKDSFLSVLNKIVDDVFIPIVSGGGIRSLEDAKSFFENGADKLIINSLLIEDKQVVKELVQQYGSQSIVGGIDYKKINNEYKVFINDGTQEVDTPLLDYIQEVIDLEVGEIYLNSIDKDGTGFGYEFEILNSLKKTISTPLIMAGGAGNGEHLLTCIKRDNVDAVATANLFNFIGNGLPMARKKMLEADINIAKWI